MGSQCKSWRNVDETVYCFYIIASVYIRYRLQNSFVIFTALHGMQTQASSENFVRLSVCQVRELRQKERKNLSRFVYRTKDHLS